MLTDLQKKKLTHMFGLHDGDKDGFVAGADYERIARNFAEHTACKPGSIEHEQLTRSYLAFWDGLKQLADTDHDGRISLEDYLAAYEQILRQKEPIYGIANAILDISDRDRDGKISLAEYTANLMAYGIAESDAHEAFRHLDRNGDGFVTRDELLKSVEEFYYGDDPSAPGNWLVGPI